MKLIQLAAVALSIQALYASEHRVLQTELTVQQGDQSFKIAQELAFQSKTLKEAYSTDPSEPIPLPEFINMQEIIQIMKAFQKNDHLRPKAQLAAVALDRSLADYTSPKLLYLLKACDYLNFRNGIRLITHCLAERIVTREPFNKKSIKTQLQELQGQMEEHLFAKVKQYVICLSAMSQLNAMQANVVRAPTIPKENWWTWFFGLSGFLIDEKTTFSWQIIWDCESTSQDDLYNDEGRDVTTVVLQHFAPYRLHLKRYDFCSSLYHRLVTLNLRNCGLSRLKKAQFLYLPNLQVLDVSNNPLQALTQGVFESQVNLKSLYLKDIQLTQIERETFKGLSELEYLNLDSNKITCLAGGCFKHLKKLKYLSLCGNPIGEIEAGVLSDMANLEVLHINASVSQKIIALIQKEAPKVKVINQPPRD